MIRTIKDIEGAAITVAGLGSHGGAVGNIRWLAEQGARLTVTDLKTETNLAESVKALQDVRGIEWVLGEHREQDFTKADCVVRNPAMPATSPWLTVARAARVPIEMDSSLLFKLAPTSDVIGVTGSKGKTTTTTTIGHVLAAQGRVHVIGVEGTSPLAILRDVQASDTIVFELSSWRLEALAEHGISPSVAVVTALYRDHLNTYPSWEAYEAAKQAIIRYQSAQDTALLNYDDLKVRSWEASVPGRVVWYSTKELVKGEALWGRNDTLEMRSANGEVEQVPFSLAELALGQHQQRNMLPAIWLGRQRGLRFEEIEKQLRQLPRLSHRLELVKRVAEVSYINDSAATIPDAAIAALDTYADQTVVLIGGGGDKELVFTDLAQRIARARVRGIILLPGTATPRLRRALLEAGVTLPITEAPTMPAAVTQAHHLAQPGDVVLLSPGATSFGLFQHEFDRGDQFRQAVLDLNAVS